LRRLAEGVNFFGEVNSDGTPGDTPPASDASRHTELVDPGGEFVREPHAVPVFGGGAEIFSVDVAVIRGEARIPDSGMFRLLIVQGRSFFYTVAKTGGADHRTVGAG